MDPPDDKVTVVELRVAAGPCFTTGVIDTDSVTVPLNPLRLVRVIVDVFEDS